MAFTDVIITDFSVEIKFIIMDKKPLSETAVASLKKKPLVAIFGAGVSGLKMAHECIKRNMEVHVYEERALPGGKCIGYIASGLPSELTHRQMFSSNTVLLETLKEIPTKTGNLLEKLEPITNVQFVWTHKDKSMDFSRENFSILTELIDNLKSANAMFFDGVPLKDIYWFKTRLTQKIKNSEEKEMPISKYFEYDKRPELAAFLHKVLSSWIAGSDFSRTGDILQLLLCKKIKASPLSPPTYSITFNGPISECLIMPWYHFLKEKGVKFHFNSKLESVQRGNTKVESVILNNGEKVIADAYAIATPPAPAIAVFPELKPLINVENIKSHGFQLHMKTIPEKFKKKTLGIIIDSAWGLSYKVYHTNKYHHTKFGEGVVATLSITATRMEYHNGIVYNKPLIECNHEEVRDEILAQMGISNEVFATCFNGALKIGPGALIVPIEVAKKEEYDSWFKGPIIPNSSKDDVCWVIQDQLINPSYKNKVHTKSSLSGNVYLGGEWVNNDKQKWTIPSTLERSMENALHCTEEIIKDTIISK
ncbi:conserved hypothetical protein [Tenacibaculum maritimum]|nr:conserved hypothetical protein [Tenacibaculum maritimum]